MDDKEVLKIIEEAAKDGRMKLDLSGKKLTYIPAAIGNLANLTELNLDGNKLTSVPAEIGKLNKLRELILHNNQLTSLPTEIGKLKNLTELYLANDQLTSLPAEIGKLNKLSGLYLHNNQLTSLPAEIGKLNKLKELDLSTNQLTSIPAEIGKLNKLKELELSGNQLTSIPAEIGNLANLTWLGLHHNQLTSIPAEIGNLAKLTRLDLDNNQLRSVPAEIGNLAKLMELYLYNNQLRSVPAEIRNLANLTDLYLYKNQLTSIPDEIGNLANLTYLSLSSNRLRSIPAEIGKLTKLKRLYLHNNQLTALPPEITDWGLEIRWDVSSDEGIFLKGNPLQSPPVEIVKRGREAIQDYFKSLEGKKQALNEVKVLLVGDGGAGKTCLVKRLLGEGYNKNEPQTHGINIRDWQAEEANKTINVHFWDFGGQEIMHATHQFFLSKRSLYVLVLDGRKEEDAEYWLKHIESFGGDSPILVVINKIDQNPAFDVNRLFLQEKYKGIKGFYRVSCEKNKGIKGFAKSLAGELAKVKLLRTTWATSWFNIKTQLENLTDNFIDCKQYEQMCDKEKIDKSGQDTLVDFLNDLGVVLHFKDFALEDMHVLQPRWVTGAVYKIINSEKLAKCKGVLKLDLLDDILKKRKKTDHFYPKDKYKYIIDLMEKFELCYRIDRKTVLIPDLLDVQEPGIDFDYGDCLRFVIEYDFLPKSVMPRFIVKMHQDIKNEFRWRTGVVLEDEAFGSTAVIKADERDKKIYIYVNGEQKRDYFSVVLFHFRQINDSFGKLQAVEKVSIPDEPGIAMSYEHLIWLEKKGIEKYIPEGSKNEYNVKDLLGTVYAERTDEEGILQILRKLRDKLDTEETLLKKASDTILLQPNFMGVGIDLKNLKKLVKKVFGKK